MRIVNKARFGRMIADFHSERTSECYKLLKKEKNNARRENILRDARRHTSLEVSIRKSL